MAYAALTDLVAMYGERELIAATTEEGTPRTTVDADKVARALTNASDLMDTYLLRRYATPVTPPTPTLVATCCKIARVDLNSTGATVPTDQMLSDRKVAMGWLEAIAAGRATLDGAVAANTSDSFSRIATRPAPYCQGRL
ncbi:phage protein Gp36 family protein [Gluconacetobacter sp.]|uniref:phage protein Gp36 family protein n=1 Tax=Gluconacetobacter sp. TaxID=1935994 RepID=UPI0039EA2F32